MIRPDDDAAATEATGDELDQATEAAVLPTADPRWMELLQYLHVARGFDFQGYKHTTLARRVRKRMNLLGVESYDAYQEFIELHQDEFRELFNTILINVTSFFRDPESWQALQTTAITPMLAAKSSSEPIRAWSAGCASGEEAYSIAMALAEEMGVDQFRARVKIYGTDVDEDALTVARHATYTDKQLENVSPELREKYFEQVDGLHAFRKDLRRQVIFGRHDLISDAPISRVDLLVCRNALMYFNAETQARILGRFHFALNDTGYLFLGRAETLMAQGQMFIPVDLKRRISRKRSRGTPEVAFRGGQSLLENGAGSDLEEHLRAAALEVSPVAQAVLDADGRLVTINEQARSLFALHQNDIGRPLRDLQLSYRPVELRSIIERAELERRTVAVKDVEWRSHAGEMRWLDLTVTPVLAGDDRIHGMLLTFTDMTGFRRLQRELEQSHMELETAYEELQSTNEELETTNEELQSTVEELETTNEELQSTNEELETMNEELQSTNEELETINDEVRQRGDALNQVNRFLESILTSLRSGVAVVDRELRLLAWSRHAEELWGVRGNEVGGQHLLNLDIGLPVQPLRPSLKVCLSGESSFEQLVIEAVNRRGKKILCQITCSPLVGADGSVAGAIIVMDEVTDGRPGDRAAS
jgi:two-component system, chemotaxis family, CheB/CheR fusion protein